MNAPNTGNAHESVWQQQIERLEDQACLAFLHQDINELGLILSDDFIVNSPINRILNKSETLDLLKRGIIRHFSYDEQIEQMTRYGDIVVVMGHDLVTNSPEGPPVRRRFTDVWRETAGSWQMIARHAHHIES
jgi:hypothetical protein